MEPFPRTNPMNVGMEYCNKGKSCSHSFSKLNNMLFQTLHIVLQLFQTLHIVLHSLQRRQTRVERLAQMSLVGSTVCGDINAGVRGPDGFGCVGSSGVAGGLGPDPPDAVDLLELEVMQLKADLIKQQILTMKLINLMCPEPLQRPTVSLEEKLGHISSLFDYAENREEFASAAIATRQSPSPECVLPAMSGKQ